MPFIHEGFDYEFDRKYYDELALKFDLESRYDPEKRQAKLWKATR